LIDKGAELDVQNCDGLTPLMLAAMSGFVETIRILIDNQCEKSIRDKNSR
jgi:ankyrin repeat protein